MTIAQIKVRRDIAINWTTVNPILADGEFGYETDTRKAKVGNGVTAWIALPYFNSSVAEDAIAEHEAATNPHPIYLTQEEATLLFADIDPSHINDMVPALDTSYSSYKTQAMHDAQSVAIALALSSVTSSATVDSMDDALGALITETIV